MAAQYLRSQTTGVVLPFNAQLLRRPNVELMTPDECTVYEDKMRGGKKKKGNGKVSKPASAPKPVKVAAPKAVTTSDISDGEPDANDLLAALQID